MGAGSTSFPASCAFGPDGHRTIRVDLTAEDRDKWMEMNINTCDSSGANPKTCTVQWGFKVANDRKAGDKVMVNRGGLVTLVNDDGSPASWPSTPSTSSTSTFPTSSTSTSTFPTSSHSSASDDSSTRSSPLPSSPTDTSSLSPSTIRRLATPKLTDWSSVGFNQNAERKVTKKMEGLHRDRVGVEPFLASRLKWTNWLNEELEVDHLPTALRIGSWVATDLTKNPQGPSAHLAESIKTILRTSKNENIKKKYPPKPDAPEKYDDDLAGFSARCEAYRRQMESWKESDSALTESLIEKIRAERSSTDENLAHNGQTIMDWAKSPRVDSGDRTGTWPMNILTVYKRMTALTCLSHELYNHHAVDSKRATRIATWMEDTMTFTDMTETDIWEEVTERLKDPSWMSDTTPSYFDSSMGSNLIRQASRRRRSSAPSTVPSSPSQSSKPQPRSCLKRTRFTPSFSSNSSNSSTDSSGRSPSKKRVAWSSDVSNKDHSLDDDWRDYK